MRARGGAVGWGTALQSRKVAGSIPDVFLVILHWRNPSGRTVSLSSTQSLTEMSTRNISLVVKAAGALDWQPYHLDMPIIMTAGSLSFLESSGPVQAYTGNFFNITTNDESEITKIWCFQWNTL
jgi:hypothetical protein